VKIKSQLLTTSIVFLASIVPLAALGQSSSTSQTASADRLETITVTAQRRVEDIQSVPISVSAFTAADLERRQIISAI
jgi:iron complex outermembrane receptor protein